MQYRLSPLFCRPWTLMGITPRLIESHYEGNYGSALRRLNAVTEEPEALDPATASGMSDGIGPAQRGLQCQLHDQRPLWLEGDRRQG